VAVSACAPLKLPERERHRFAKIRDPLLDQRADLDRAGVLRRIVLGQLDQRGGVAARRGDFGVDILGKGRVMGQHEAALFRFRRFQMGQRLIGVFKHLGGMADPAQALVHLGRLVQQQRGQQRQHGA
jgi:hypothetical protein